MSSPDIVLVVEDDEDSRDLIDQILTDAGYSVVLASDGAEALRKLERCAPILIVTDLSMPRMDGLQFCARVREHPAGRDVPVIFVSATEVFREKLRAFDAGANDFLAKPIDEAELVRRARKLVELTRTRVQMDAVGQKR